MQVNSTELSKVRDLLEVANAPQALILTVHKMSHSRQLPTGAINSGLFPDLKAVEKHGETFTELDQIGGRLQVVRFSGRAQESQHFQHSRELGSGKFGTVDEVVHVQSGCLYARKTLPDASGQEQAARHEALLKEAGFLSRLNRRSPNWRPFVRAVLAYTTPTADPSVLRYSLILDPVADGGDLETFMKRYRTGRPDPFLEQKASDDRFFLEAPSILLGTFEDLAGAVRLIRENKLRHRDIKPPNVLIHRKRVLLSDFGFAQVYGGDRGETLGSSGPAGIKNHRYRAPEVLDGGTRSDKTDVYSLGCTFVEIVATMMGERCPVNPWPEEQWFGEGPDKRVAVHVFAEKLDEIIGALQGIPLFSLNASGLGQMTKLVHFLIPRMLQRRAEDRPTAEEVEDMFGEGGEPAW